ncbi:hypothetical protein DV515_00006694, partial [Chloebia gouldiae]
MSMSSILENLQCPDFSPGSQTPHLTQTGILGSAFCSDNMGQPSPVGMRLEMQPQKLYGSWWFPEQEMPNTNSISLFNNIV